MDSFCPPNRLLQEMGFIESDGKAKRKRLTITLSILSYIRYLQFWLSFGQEQGAVLKQKNGDKEEVSIWLPDVVLLVLLSMSRDEPGKQTHDSKGWNPDWIWEALLEEKRKEGLQLPPLQLVVMDSEKEGGIIRYVSPCSLAPQSDHRDWTAQARDGS